MSSVVLNTKEYKDTFSTKEVKVRFRVKTSNFDRSYQTDYKAKVNEICMFSGNCVPLSKNYNYGLLGDLKRMQTKIKSLVDGNEGKQYEEIKLIIDEGLKTNNSATIKDVLYYYEQYIDNLKKYGTIKDSTLKNQNTVLHSLVRFKENFLHIKEVKFSDINKNWLQSYKLYMTHESDYCKGKRIGTKYAINKSENAVSHYITIIKTFLDDCVSNDIIEQNPFDKLTIGDKRILKRKEKKAVEALTMEEFEKIKNANLNKRLDNTRNVFLLQCFVGCRQGDLNKCLKIDYFQDKLGLIPYVSFLPSKTERSGEYQVVPLVKSCYELLTNNELRLLNLSNYNRNLKLLFKELNIQKNGCSHIARRTKETFCQNFQPDLYISGIHKAGSDAIKRYNADDKLRNLKISSLAFCEPLYRVIDGKVVITGEEKEKSLDETLLDKINVLYDFVKGKDSKNTSTIEVKSVEEKDKLTSEIDELLSQLKFIELKNVQG